MIFLVMVVSQKSQAFQPDPRTPTIGLLSGEFTRPAGGETAFPHAIFGVGRGRTRVRQGNAASIRDQGVLGERCGPSPEVLRSRFRPKRTTHIPRALKPFIGLRCTC